MEMSKTQDNLENILSNILQYIQIYEGCLSEANSDYVLASFKHAKFVEDALQQAEKDNCLDQFLALLKSFTKEKLDRDLCYPPDFYQQATGNLLKSYFKSNLAVCDVAVKMFLALKSEAALGEVITDIIVDAESCKSINEYIIQNQAEIDWDVLQCDLLMNAWSCQLKVGNSKSIAKAIDSMLNVYKIEHNLKTLLYMLSSSESLDDLKELILSKLKPKMTDRSVSSEKFWLVLLNKAIISLVLQSCVNNFKFCELYLHFLVYFVSMFNSEDDFWVLDENSMCSAINFSDVMFILTKFYNSSDLVLRDYSRSRFSEARNSIGTDVWFEVGRRLHTD